MAEYLTASESETETERAPSAWARKLEEFLSDDRLNYDLRGGVIHSPMSLRLGMVNTDLLSGIIAALKDETGPAWYGVLKKSGEVWGELIFKRLESEYQKTAGIPLSKVAPAEFISLLMRYFAFYGWGMLSLDLGKLQTNGVIYGELRDSIFLEVMDQAEPNRRIDGMISGALGRIFSLLSQTELDCEELVHPGSNGASRKASRFILTARRRLAPLADEIAGGMNLETLQERLGI